jgi:GGDEF domain-containing protein
MQPVTKQPLSKPDGQVSLEDCLLTLLRGIQNHLVIADSLGGQKCRKDLAALESRFPGKENAGLLVESALEILDKYGSQAMETNARQKSGLGSAAADLAGAMKALAEMQGSVDRWNRVEEQIKAISSEDNLELVKARLCADVAAARAEALLERQKMGALFAAIPGKLELPPNEVRADLDASPALRPESAVYAADPTTGLPSRASAEAELRHVHGHSPDGLLVLFIVKRLALINAKFGQSRGDHVLLKVVTYLAQSLSDFNNLFRWAPCALLTLAPPKTSLKTLRAKVLIIEATRLTPTIEWKGSSAIVPVSVNCRIVALKDFSTPSELFLRLDTLATEA